jgi:hypothetical protein
VFTSDPWRDMEEINSRLAQLIRSFGNTQELTRMGP